MLVGLGRMRVSAHSDDGVDVEAELRNAEVDTDNLVRAVQTDRRDVAPNSIFERNTWPICASTCHSTFDRHCCFSCIQSKKKRAAAGAPRFLPFLLKKMS